MNVLKLAEMTGVSKSTIYRALNGDKIKDSTRQRIIDFINENDINFSFSGFETNHDSRVKLIALVTSQSFRNRSAVAEHIKSKFSENGFTVIEIPSESVENGSADIETYINKNFRSFIFMGYDMDEKCKDFITSAAKDRPVILIHSRMSGKNIYSITSTERETVSKAVQKLSDDYGHKNFLYCISDKTEIGRTLSYGFEDGIKLSGLGRNNFCSADCNSSMSPADAIASALRSNPTTTAIITQDETTAVLAATVATKAGLKIPRDITIVGFRNAEMITSEHHDIACIDARSETISDMTLTLTIAAINGKKTTPFIEIPCTFTQRKTVGKAAIQYSQAM